MIEDWDRLTSQWDDEIVRLRAELRLTDERIHEIHHSGTHHDPALHAAMAERGWLGMAWSDASAYAGDPLRMAHTCALWMAANYHRLPVDYIELTEMVAFAVHQAGPNEQQRSFLDAVTRGEVLGSLGFSEPDAGSDVAAARTSARRDGDEWVIDGAKIFTTGAHVADYTFLLARTSTGARKHDGLTMFLVPLRTAGIEIQAIHTLGGERTNAVFYSDVRLPADAVVGGVDRGWSALMTGLAFERSLMSMYIGRARRLFDDLIAVLARRGPLPRAVADDLALVAARIEVASASVADVAGRIVEGQPFSIEAATTKLLATEVFKDLSYLAIDVVGPEALVSGTAGAFGDFGALEDWFRGAQVSTIYGGSNEVQRNIIARHRLHLPTA